jgi:choline dehydrogenase-like flavoprotein
MAAKGLRVCDASVLPVVVAGQIQVAVYAVAKRAADMILGLEGRGNPWESFMAGGCAS